MLTGRHSLPQSGNAQARTQLAMLLASATEERFRTFTADGLAAMFRLHGNDARNKAEIAAMLVAEVRRRDG
jgi:hypothetical protein